MNKRFLSFIMVLCMIISMVPAPVQAEEVAESHMHNSTTYSKWTGSISNYGGNYYLEDDYTLTKDIIISNTPGYSEKSYNICLNGHTFDFNGYSITIEGQVSFMFCDCTGGIEHKYTPDENGRWIPDDDGTESVTCGALYNAKIIADNNGRYPTVNFNDIAILGSTGPAIKATESIIRLTNCIVAGNYGRVVECTSTNARGSMRFEPKNTVFRNNYSNDYVIYFDGSKFASSSFTNCTISDNEAGIDIIHDKTSETVLRLNDCLVQNNKAAKNTIYLYMQGSPFIGGTRIENNINREGYAVYIENSGYGVYGLHFGGVTIIDSNYNEIGENKNVRIEELIGNSSYDYYFSAYANYEYPNPGSRIGISLVNVGGILAIDNGYSGFKSDVASCFYPDISYVGDKKVVITCDERVSNSSPAKYKTLITKYSGQPSDPTSIGLTQTEIELAPSNTYQLGVTVSPSNAKRPDSVNWSSSNENVATVNNSGVVTSVSNGTAVITASAGALTATCTVVVDGPAAYEVTLITNGGEIANGKNVTSYAEGTGVSLPGASDITKEHSEFMGWYADSEFNGDPVDSISNQDTGAKIYYAKWERTAYVVDATANPDNGGEVTGEGAYAPDATATVTAIANNNYYFKNWTVSGQEVSTATTYAFTVTTDCALVANFMEKSNPTYTAPTKKTNLIYDGTIQTLLNEGSVTNGTLKYSIDGNTWIDEIPTGSAAGNYTVYYKIIGDENYKDIAQTTITIEIAKRIVEIAWDGEHSYVYDGTEKSIVAPAVTNLAGEDAITLTVIGTTSATIAGTYTATVTNIDNTNYTLAGCSTVTKQWTIARQTISPVITLTAPVANEVAMTTTAGVGYTANIEWSPAVSEKFAYSTTYTAVITITPESNYTTEGIAANGYSIVGATVTNDANATTLTAEFAKTGAVPARPIPSGNTGATVPETPVATAPAIIPIATDAGIKAENCVNDDTCPANHFKDTSADAWYHDGLHFVVETGIMQGTEDGFKPFAKTDRATIVTVLYRLAGSPEVKNSGTFSDVESGKWYSDAIEWAAANGIVLGYGDDVYGPADVVTRQQMATIFYRFATYMGIDVTSDVSLDGYNDTDMISDYAYDAMNWSVDSGLINGTSENQLSPQADSNRAQLATILMRFCEDIIK